MRLPQQFPIESEVEQGVSGEISCRCFGWLTLRTIIEADATPTV